MVNFLFWICLVLVALLGWLLLDNYHQAEKQAHKQMKELHKQNYYEAVYRDSKKQLDKHLSVARVADTQWQFYAIDERKVQE